MADPEPYLTLVATSRNDEHGGSLLRRMQAFVSGFAEQCRRHGLDAELILVEWNPPADRPRLREALRWPALGPCRVRLIEVSGDVHRRFRHSDQLPLFQMIAKNAGIRRAEGRFVLATNIDLLFSDEIVAFLASRALAPERMYRVDRHDVMPDLPVEAGIEAQLDYCASHLLRVHAREGTFPLLPDGRRARLRPRSGRPRRWLRAGMRALQPRRKVPTPAPLHINGCGDFTLLSREKWHELRGYPELEIFSFNLDSVLCHAAHHAGARESVLTDPMRIYHIEHSRGSGWTPEGEEELFRSLKTKGIPWLEHDVLLDWTGQMARFGAPMIFNGDGWGLADVQLPETAPRDANRHAGPSRPPMLQEANPT